MDRDSFPYKPGDRVVTERGRARVSAIDLDECKVHLVYDGPEMWSGWRKVEVVYRLRAEGGDRG